MTAGADPGLQPERTELSWQRSALSLAAGSVVAARVLPDAFQDVWWALPGVLGCVAAAVIWFRSNRRRRAYSAALHHGAATPGAVMPAMFALTVSTIGAFALGTVLALRL